MTQLALLCKSMISIVLITSSPQGNHCGAVALLVTFILELLDSFQSHAFSVQSKNHFNKNKDDPQRKVNQWKGKSQLTMVHELLPVPSPPGGLEAPSK